MGVSSDYISMNLVPGVHSDQKRELDRLEV